MRINKAVLMAVSLLFLSLISGCGYHFGSIMHPQVKSIAIAPVTNDTLEYNVAAIMRGMLAERFNVDGSLKVTSQEKADCVIYCVIKNVETISTSEDTYDNEVIYRPAEWEVEVTAEFQVIIPGRAKPLIAKRTASGIAEYSVVADHQAFRSRGIKMACYAAAEKVVSQVTEGW
jgi:outer membrane lipopolysaccharide assembly protein LptE/RlpB